ncbi:sugar ABC transporter ATP-binding protein [bacterium]|nr:sugar ABC transporter ATP-binding protein [bacterium]
MLTAAGITVRFGGTTALDAVDFELRAGEIHALVGENGAGKSTLLRVIAGARRADEGALALAPRARVAWAPQDPELPPDCTAAEWIFLGAELRGRCGWLRRDAMRAGAAAALATIGSAIPPTARCGDLPASQRKQVQLARALGGADRQARDSILLLDEPTAVLGAEDAARLFAAVRAARAAGAGVVYVSHRLDEVLALADRVTVLRDGRRVATAPASEVDAGRLVQMMVGRDIDAAPAAARQRGAVVLAVAGLCAGRLRDVSLRVHAGEIVGVAGLLGAGRSALLECVAGIRARTAGTMTCAVPPVLLGEDRARTGLVPTFGLRENVFLPAAAWRLDHAGERQATRDWMARLAIRAAGPEAPIASLSGGNQQKALLARALRRGRGLLLLDEPTAGVDVGAKADIHTQVRGLAAAGAAVLLASSDLPELLRLCDRIVALYAGEAVGEFDARGCGEAVVVAAITGQKASPQRRSGAEASVRP